MKNMLRTQLPAWSPTEIDRLLKTVTQRILERVQPEKLIAFGSSVNGKFDEASDIDLVLIFKETQLAKAASQKLYADSLIENRTIDYLCVDEATFAAKAAKGGVYFIAATEGRVLYSKT